MSPSGNSNPSDLYGDAIHDQWGTYQPTLGPTWHHCVSTRLTIRIGTSTSTRSVAATTTTTTTMDGDDYNSMPNSSNNIPVRCLSITKSPVAAPYELDVIIAPTGVVARS